MNGESEIIEQAGMVCPSCADFISVNQTFCPTCNAPISLLSNVDPVQSVLAQGSFYRKTTEAKPKLVVLIGAWVMFLPCVLVGFGFAIALLYDGIGGGSVAFMIFWVCLLIGVFGFVMIYRVTKNYFTLKPKNFDDYDV